MIRSVALRSCLAVLLAGPLLASLASAEALPADTVHIRSVDLAPEALSVRAGETFVLANRSTALARVEFDLPRGEGIACRAGSDAQRRARKFVVSRDAELVCTSDGRRFEYRVYRNVRLATGRFEKVESVGRVVSR